MWPPRKPTPPRDLTLDDAGLDRAIRAGVQFPLDWFLSQPPDVQEAIASRRDLWLEDLVVAAGYAILDPERTRLGLAAENGDEDAEATLAGLNAREVAEEIGRRAARNGSGEPPRRPPVSMSGLGERRQAATDAAEAGRRKGALFGAQERGA